MADNITLIFSLPGIQPSIGLSGAIIVDFPVLTSVIELRSSPYIVADLPLLTSTISSRTGEVSTIAFNLGFPSLDDSLNSYIYVVVKEIRADLPALSFAGTYFSTPLVMPINAILPKLTSAIHAIYTPPDFIISGTLPILTSYLHVITGNLGSISSAIRPPSISLHATTGSVGSLILTLPRLTISSSILSAGSLSIVSTLPALLFDAVGHLSNTNLLHRAIIINTKLFGATEYSDLSLTGLTQVFGKTIALNDTSIITLGSSFDAGNYIASSFRTGTIDFSNPYYVKPKDIWIKLHSGYRLRLTVRADELPDEYEYDSESFIPILKKTRVKIGRGFYNAFYDFTIENINGELLDIENIHILSELITGRKR